MKKTLIAIALAAMIAPAWGAEVVSSNIVGYNKVQLKAGLNMISSQFVLVGGEDATVNSLPIVSGQNSYDSSFEPTTTLKIWDGRGYDDFGWTGDFLADSAEMAGELGVTDNSYDNKWLNMDYEIAEDPLEPGTGFWIKAENAGTVLLSGEVPEGDTVTLPITAGLNMVAYPWPMDASLQKIVVTGQNSYDDSFEPTTTIKVWDGRGYDDYGWTGNFLTDSPDMAGELGVTDNSYDNKWLNMDYEIEETPIPIGTGFWIKAENNGTVIFSK